MQKFDEIVTSSIDIAYSEASQRKNNEVYAAHLLLGLMLNPNSQSFHLPKSTKEKVENIISNLPQVSQPVPFDSLRPSGDFTEWLTRASAQATKKSLGAVAEDLLLELAPSILPQISMSDLKATESAAEQNQLKVPDFLMDLCALAREGKLDPVIGRTKEIRAVMEILGRRTKNNPVLVGPAGVGKTAIVEGLALAIQKDKVPDVLKGKTVYSLNMGTLTAGTKFRGEFEERMQQLIKFIKSQAGAALLFIDELHLLVGAGKTEGAMDAANLLKPALARGELLCIGATTAEEYRKYIMDDAALDRRFRPVPVNEPTKEEAIEILMGVKEKLESHHGIKISDDAVYSSVMLSDQYITDKNLPDKAIDLIDEAASAMKISAEAMPAKLAELESEIRSKKVLAQVSKDNTELEPEIQRLEQTFEAEKKKWSEEVNSIKRVAELKNRIDALKFQLEKYEAAQNYERASEIKYALIPAAERELAAFTKIHELTRSEVAAIISRHTGIPVEKILKSTQENLLQLEDYLKQTVFGQDGVLHEISEILISSHAGLTDPNRPLGSFLLKGPSGVGKTETAKAIARFLFNSEHNLIRLDLSEYSEKHSVAKLIGAPAGYIGYEDSGVLTEAVRKKPYAVILFDEIEKAHPDFADILLQILDEGHLTDNKGRTVNFKNTIVFLTTNSRHIEEDFKPEVLGRLNAVLTYEALSRSSLRHIIDKQLTLLNQRLSDKKTVIELDDSMYSYLAEHGYSETYGARPLHAIFDKMVVRPLAKQILEGTIRQGVYRLSWSEKEGVITQKIDLQQAG
jgi:ATP-dependent Clp protease ATP-binding subunit ClpB